MITITFKSADGSTTLDNEFATLKEAQIFAVGAVGEFPELIINKNGEYLYAEGLNGTQVLIIGATLEEVFGRVNLTGLPMGTGRWQVEYHFIIAGNAESMIWKRFQDRRRAEVFINAYNKDTGVPGTDPQGNIMILVDREEAKND